MANASVLAGTTVPRPAGLIAVDGRTYPLKSARIEARAEGGVAATNLTQTYENPYQESLEVLYTLPLPAHGAVIGYTVRIGQKVIRGEVRRRSEAREEYRKALLEGRTAALLEQDRADTFTQKLGCLPPGETARVEIEILQPLAFLPADGRLSARWEYRFPTVAGVRYEGAPGRVPDAERLDIDRAAGDGTPVRLAATLFVADGAAGDIHPEVQGQEAKIEDHEHGVNIVLSSEMKLNRDLVIRWGATRQEVGVRLVEGKGLPCDPGRYLLITITPPAAVNHGLARDLTILIDASGSMSGKPLSRAKIVAEELVQSLDPGDRFEILAFAEQVERLAPGPMTANKRNVEKALAALARLDAGGATEMTRAITEALSPLRPDAQRQVILLSDGYIGFEGEVIAEVRRRLTPGARLHVVGLGAAPNRTLTRGAARAGRGVEILVGDDDDAKTASRRLLRATVRPVLTDLEVRGSALVALAPQEPQDVLEGQPLVLFAEIAAAGGSLEIRGRQAGENGLWSRQIEIHRKNDGVPATDIVSGSINETNLPLGALFGREAIEDVELQIASGQEGGAGKLELKIEDLGLRHGIASRKTSLVAIAEDVTVDPRDPRRRERLAVELPAEVSAEGVGLAPALFAAGPPARMQMDVSYGRTFMDVSPRKSFEQFELADAEESPFLLSERISPSEYHEYEPVPETPRRDFGLGMIQARILQIDDGLCILEFEVPEPEFLLPGDGFKIDVCFDNSTWSEARVLANESSRQGPHDAGLTVRLGLILDDQRHWADHGEARISLAGPGGREVVLHLVL